MQKMQPAGNLQNRSKQSVQQNSKPGCEICGDFGFYRVDVPESDPRFGKLVRCGCKANDDATRLQRLSGLTETERMWRLADIKTAGRPMTLAMVEACSDFLLSPFGFLSIWGKSGNAKTVALQACVNALVNVGVEAVYITVFDLMGYVQEAFTENKEVKSESAYNRIVRFGTVPFLAIDEFDKLNKIFEQSWTQGQITDLIDRRYRLGQDGQAGTMIAMNSSPEDLPMWIYSRMSQGVIVRNDDPDLRPYLKG
jgi:DNA replication protein DnaC